MKTFPNAERIKALTDDSDLEEVVATERHLLMWPVPERITF